MALSSESAVGPPGLVPRRASIAAALGVTVSEITVVGEAPVDLPESSAPDEHNAVVLRRTSSGKTLLDTLCDSFSGHLDCAADPTQENVDALTALVEDIENLIANP
jgi:hypothetical protein